MLVEKAIETLKLTSEGWYEPEVYRIAAKVMLKKPDRDRIAAEQYLRRAIEIAKARSAKWWELRATTSLARLLSNTTNSARGGAPNACPNLQLVH
jgi:predicted ATPase